MRRHFFRRSSVIRVIRSKEVSESLQPSLNSDELETLVSAVRQGETEKYEPIVRAFQQPIFRYCYRLFANRQDAEDAVQDILVKAYRSLGQYRRADNFQAWLYRIAYRHCLNVLRRRRIHRQVMKMLRPETVTAGPEQELDDRLYHPSLARALAELSPRERSLLILRAFEEKSFAELGHIMQTSPNALVKRMQRIKQKVRTSMKSKEDMPWNDSKHPMNTEV